MNTDSMFEYATRERLRFSSPRGELSVEQLWDVPLRSKDGFDLNTIAKAVSKKLKESETEEFVETAKTQESTRAGIALEVVKYIIKFKLDEAAAAKKQAENRLEKEKLLKILAEKQDGKLSSLSEEELRQKIQALS